ncbi:MAG: hypothetical protein ACYTG4_12660 [Planctomycetota bacterium]|jgi:hypothetical protein
MKKSLWVMAGMGLVAVIALTIGSQSMLTSYSGIDETLRLQDLVRSAYGRLFKEEPPVRVLRSMGGRDEGWAWRVEGHLRSAPGRGFDRIIQRLAHRCASTHVGGGRAKQTVLVLHLPGGGERRLEFDAAGNPVGAAPPRQSPQPVFPPAVEPGPIPSEEDR